MLQLDLLQEVKHLIPISGKDSLATAIVQTTQQPELDYQFLFNDTGSEYPEVYEWIAKVESVMGWTIDRTNTKIFDKIHSWNGFLPSHQQRWCTKDCKIKPMDEYLAGCPTYAYYGLRADENRTGFIPTRKNNLYPIYPLKDLGITLPMVWAIVAAKDLMPPSFEWIRLKDAVLEVYPECEWSRPLEVWEWRQLFSGRTRSNCYHCFYQRLYEWLWCYEMHPDLFEKSRSHEKSDYTWNKDHPLRDWDNPVFRAKIFDKRVKEVVSILKGLTKEYDSEITSVSCGLICGK
jgi:hypothetical protein